MFQNKPLHFSGWQTDKNIRLFKKEKAKAPVILLKWWAMGAAAVFLFMMVRYGILDQKGGTALSKCFKLIERFSEDIDFVVLRNDKESGLQIRDIGFF